ncbi:MAG: DMT family transporter [Proteobacteria bacterium]|nr:DMT family transporter [Pseudomonadota bacterium]
MTSNQKGILFMLGSVAVYTVMGLIIKYVSSAGVPIAVMLFFRQWIVLLLCLPWLVRTRNGDWRSSNPGQHLLRGVLALSSYVLLVIALRELYLADAVALAYTNPLWSILIAFFLLHEPVRIRRWTATMIGFLGVLMVVRPAGDIHPAMLAALGSAITASFSMMFIKKLTATESPSKILFYFSVIGSALSLLPAIVFWQTPSAEMAAWMTLMAMCAYVGSLMLARSFALAEITLVAPMDFLRLPIAALVGLTLFNEVPDLWTIAGGLVIAGASAYIARRDAMARKARSPRNPTV